MHFLTWRRLLGGFAASLVLMIVEGNLSNSLAPWFFDRCNIDRATHRDNSLLSSSTVSTAVFSFSQLCLFVLFLDIVFFQHQHHHRHGSQRVASAIRDSGYFAQLSLKRRSLFFVSFVVAWWLSTYMVVVSLKVLLHDTACHAGSPNSVSGHFAFHLFFMFSAIYLLVSLKRDTTNLGNYWTFKPFKSKK
jgi:hypothetical protein